MTPLLLYQKLPKSFESSSTKSNFLLKQNKIKAQNKLYQKVVKTFEFLKEIPTILFSLPTIFNFKE